MVLAKVDNAVQSAAIVTSRPLLNKVANINYVRVWSDWNWDPASGGWVKDLKTF